MKTSITLLLNNEWDNTPISKIVKKAYVSRNSFYRNFTSKENIIEEYLKDISKEWTEMFNSEENFSFSNKLKILFDHCENHKKFYKSLYDHNLMHLFKNFIVNSIKLSKDDSPLEAYTKSYVVYTIYGWVEVWIQRGMKESAGEIATMFSSIK